MTGHFNRESLIVSTAISIVLAIIACGFLFTQDRPSLPKLDVKHTPPPDFFENEQRAYMDAPFEVALVFGRTPGCQNADGSLIDLIAREALRAGVNPKILAATVAVESRCDPLAVSARGAVGLTQVRARVWRTKFDFSRINLFNPSDNLHTGAVIMADLIRQHGIRVGLQHYNGATVGSDHGYSEHVLALAGVSPEASPTEQRHKISRLVHRRRVGDVGENMVSVSATDLADAVAPLGQ